MDSTQQQLLNRMGIADAMAAHCRQTAGKLADRADEAERTIIHETGRLARHIREVGVGADPQAEGEYCRLLGERRRVAQSWELSNRDRERFPDLPERVKKGVGSFVPLEIAAEAPAEPSHLQPRPEAVPELSVEPYDPSRAVYLDGETSEPTGEIVCLFRSQDGRSVTVFHNDHMVVLARAAGADFQGVEIPEYAYRELRERYSGGEIAYAMLIEAACFDEADALAYEHPEGFVARAAGAARDLLQLLLKRPLPADRGDALFDVSRDLYGAHEPVQKGGRGEYVPPDVPIYRIGRPTPNSYLPLNGVEDLAKYRAMVEAMETGEFEWRVPLIRCGDQLITGSHRYAACRATETPVETKTLDSLFRASGLSLREVWERNAMPLVSWLSNLDLCIKELPEEVRDEYGIDLG